VPKLIGGGAKQTPHEIKNLEGESPVLIASGGEVVRGKAADKPGKEKVDKGSAREITNSIGMKLVRIPAGKFMMGSPASEVGHDKDEEQHEVEITRDFYLGMHEVTQAQYKKVMGKNPSYFSAGGGGKDKVKGIDTDDFPVENVSYDDAVELCKKLSALLVEWQAGRTYRLPTEAEWEYSCRGGASSSKPFHFGTSLSSTQANFNNNLKRTCKVGSYDANPFGLRDMHGNVWEWCADRYAEDYYPTSLRRDPRGPASGSYRVFRGGGWGSVGRHCRSADRNWRGPDYRGNFLGFRVALVPSEDR
jgi:formylglycine-generating enzyme required for sulfatase activity